MNPATSTRFLSTVAFTLSIVILAPAVAAAREPVRWVDNVKVPMSDGVNLEADVCLPASGEKFPVVFLRTPYSRRQMRPYLPEPLADNGYAVVMQDVRGMGGSGGMFIPFIYDKQDGLDTLDWIAKQQWCNGKVGMWGSSYMSYCSLIVVPEQHPALAAVFNISGWGTTTDMTSPGGAMHLMIGLPWTLSGQIRGQGSIYDIDWEKAFRYVPVTKIPTVLGIQSEMWEGLVDLHTEGVLLETAAIAHRYDRVRTPIMHFTGWNDFVARHTLDVYEGIDQAKIPAKNRPFQKLVVGPWHHDQQWGTSTVVGDEDFGKGAAMGMPKIVELTIRWFDHCLKGADNGMGTEKPVTLFVMGPNKWRTFDHWPPKATTWQKWYVSSGGDARTREGNGRLAVKAPASAGTDTFVYDPMDPVPTTGGVNCHFFPDTLGVRDMRVVEQREDVLVYTSAPLGKDLTVIGPLQAVVYAATEGKHTDFTAKLVEVRPDGYARPIEDGIRRGPDVTPIGKIQTIEPGKVYAYTIDLGGTAVTVPKGNRLRVEISSSNFPKFTRNPNTGENPESATEFNKVTQTVYHSAEYPSHVVLPVLESD